MNENQYARMMFEIGARIATQMLGYRRSDQKIGFAEYQALCQKRATEIAKTYGYTLNVEDRAGVDLYASVAATDQFPDVVTDARPAAN